MTAHRISWILAGLFALTSSSGRAADAPAPTVASVVDRQISTIEKEVVEAAEAMPEDKFNFSPDSLNLPGSDYKGVRSFAEQIKHIAPPTISSGARSPARSCRNPPRVREKP